jgi:hypothetical protein
MKGCIMDVDIRGIKSLLKGECVDCNLHIRRIENNICSNCNFGFNTQYATKRGRVCPSSIFRKYGVLNPDYMGKHKLYYLLHYPELNFELPHLPDEDLFGNTSSDKKFVWHIHHLNREYWNDSIWNLLLCLNTEHNQFDALWKNL